MLYLLICNVLYNAIKLSSGHTWLWEKPSAAILNFPSCISNCKRLCCSFAPHSFIREDDKVIVNIISIYSKVSCCENHFFQSFCTYRTVRKIQQRFLDSICKKSALLIDFFQNIQCLAFLCLAEVNCFGNVIAGFDYYPHGMWVLLLYNVSSSVKWKEMMECK